MTQPAQHEDRGVTRRVTLCGAAVSGVALPLLAACGGSGSASAPGGSSAPGGGVSLKAADVPVGGGVILKDDKIVVTQPTRDEFLAFTAICTHQGCTVGSVEDGEIVCPCHGSRFSIEDGSATKGPATAPLTERTVSVEGATVSVS